MHHLTSRIPFFRRRPAVIAVALLSLLIALAWTAIRPGQLAAAQDQTAFDPQQQVKPFFKQNCVRCHNEETSMSGVRVDQLDATSFEDRHLRLWEHVRKRIADGTMPPKGQKQQPSPGERQQMAAWIATSLDAARMRPSPKNGLVRRLTISQYRNTLRELLLLDDDLTEGLPPDAVSSDGFVNNKDTLQLSPMLLEAYFEIASEALNRSIVDPAVKPAIQHFRMELGASINPHPLPEQLILGADSLLLQNKDFTVTQPPLSKPFPFDPIAMRTKYRFIEGYQGNDTVRGWREYDSIYHAVFACMRGNRGYPKGQAYSTVPQGLLLRSAIPSDELFGGDGTYGPKANFKISLRELPDKGRFRVTVTAAKYNDGLLLDKGAAAQVNASAAVSIDPKAAQTVTIPKPGVYQVDVHLAPQAKPSRVADASHLEEKLAVRSLLDGRLEGDAHLVDSPFGKAALSLDGDGDFMKIPRGETIRVGEGDFTVAAWIHPSQLRRGGIIAAGGHNGSQGWYLEMPNDKGVLRFETTGPGNQANGSITSQPALIRPESWQHVAAVVKRGTRETRLYVNGYAVAKGEIGKANLDNPELDLHIGRIPDAQHFKGEIDQVRIYRRALGEAEIQALVEPGKQFMRQPPPEKPQNVTLTLGARQFLGIVQQPAFLAVRLEAGAMPLQVHYAGVTEIDRIEFTPVPAGQELAERFLAFEKRTPRVGVYLGLRRDCGSTLAPAGSPKTVAGDGKFARYVFEGAIRNFPSPDVEKDNVNYLAGVREIGVRSEFTDGRDMPRMLVRSVEFEGPLYEAWPPPSHRSIFIDSAHKGDQPAYAREIIRNFATRAYRRPVTAAEEASLFAVFQKSFAAAGNFRESVKDALQVVLTSPQFLFLIENSQTPEPEPLDNYEIASKLSYFLWNGPPDRKALQRAAAGATRKQLDAEVTRMIGDARFANFIREFTAQWLSLDKFSVLEPDRKRFPKLTRDTRTQLRQEPMEFVQHLIRNNLPVRNLIDSDFVLVNEAVADYYGLAEKTESGFQFVAIPHRRPELGGVLTQAAILAGLSDGRESNPVKRGAWLARKIIAEPPDPPPPNVPALKEDAAGQLTLRQRIEQHRNQPGCQQCHSKIDPWGIAFEEFDAGGRLKLQPVDARSKLPDQTEVAGAKDLKRYLGEDRIDQVAYSVLKHLATYATGRSLTYSELHHLKQDSLQLKAGGYRTGDMIHFIVNNKLFLEK